MSIPRVYRARWVLPVSSPPIPHGAVMVEGERIGWVGPAAEAPPGEHVDLGRAVLMPGLVNAHTHLELTAMRGLLEGLPFRQWIARLTRFRKEVMSAERHLASARVGLAEGLLAGVTCYADCTDAGIVVRAMADTGVRGIAYKEVFGPDPDSATAAVAELGRRVGELQAAAPGLVAIGVSPHSPYTVSDALFRAVADYASEERLRLAVHVAESEDECELVSAGRGPFADWLRARSIDVSPRGESPVEMLERAGILGGRTLLVHGVRLSAADIGRAAAAGCALAHCPASNAKLGHGIAPIREVREAGIAVGLGTDSVASSNRMDLLDEGRLASLMQRARTGAPDALPAGDIVHLATLGGARALGLDDEIGSLEQGKAADLAAFAVDSVADDEAADPAVALVFGTARRRAVLVAVAGRELVRDGRLERPVAGDVEMVARAAEALRAIA